MLGACNARTANGPSGSSSHFSGLRPSPARLNGTHSVTAIPPALPCEARSPSKSRSTSVTFRPRRCADLAQLRPTMPLPTTITSVMTGSSLQQEAVTQRISLVDEDRVVASDAGPAFDARNDRLEFTHPRALQADAREAGADDAFVHEC